MNLQRKASIFFNCLIIVVSIIIGLLGYHSANEGFEIALEDKADSDIRQSLAILDLKYPGEWQMVNGNLYKGEQKIDGAFEIVDELGKLTGNNVTIFNGSNIGMLFMGIPKFEVDALQTSF